MSTLKIKSQKGTLILDIRSIKILKPVQCLDLYNIGLLMSCLSWSKLPGVCVTLTYMLPVYQTRSGFNEGSIATGSWKIPPINTKFLNEPIVQLRWLDHKSYKYCNILPKK